MGATPRAAVPGTLDAEGLVHIASPFPATVLREPSASASCTCRHYAYCDHACHHRICDPTENACDLTYLPDEGGLAMWGCAACTPGEGSAHILGCELIGWNVPARQDVPA